MIYPATCNSERQLALYTRQITLNTARCARKPIVAPNLIELVTMKANAAAAVKDMAANPREHMLFAAALDAMVMTSQERLCDMQETIDKFMFLIHSVRGVPCRLDLATSPSSSSSSPSSSSLLLLPLRTRVFKPVLSWLHPAAKRLTLFFPDRRLIQFDSGKLQV